MRWGDELDFPWTSRAPITRIFDTHFSVRSTNFIDNHPLNAGNSPCYGNVILPQVFGCADVCAPAVADQRKRLPVGSGGSELGTLEAVWLIDQGRCSLSIISAVAVRVADAG
jgi:hypothetical protein